MRIWKKKEDPTLTSDALARRRLLTQNSPFAVKEAYNAIRTKLLFTGKGEKCPVFAVTSSLMHDGKTTNAVNLAVSIAFANKHVLLIDADLRKPTVHRYFGLENKEGLSEILAGLSNEIRIRKTDVENLNLLTSGQIPPNPAELLGSAQMDNLLDYVKNYFDYVVIDTPPINVVTDAAILAEKITGYVFVVQGGKNQVQDVRYALDTLEQMNGRVVGMVLNDVSGKTQQKYSYRSRNYGYYRGYYRHSDYEYNSAPRQPYQSKESKPKEPKPEEAGTKEPKPKDSEPKEKKTEKK